MRWLHIGAIFVSFLIGGSHWFPQTPESQFYRDHGSSLRATRSVVCREDVLSCGRRFPGRARCRLLLYREAGAAWLMPAGQVGRLRYCRCLPAWHGDRCQFPADPCRDGSCPTGQLCLRDASVPAGLRCRCSGDGSGAGCDSPALRSPRRASGACAGRPCGEGWRCTPDAASPAGYSCNCRQRPGYRAASPADPTCVVADPCAVHRPCHHGGTCLAVGADFRCQCGPAWTGAGCQAPLNPCQDAQLCTAGWTCRRDPRAAVGYSCGCDERPGWEPRSEEDPQCVLRDVCLARNPCLHGATCSPGPADGFTCRCTAAWQGATCERPRDPCRTRPCGDTWKCRRNPSSPAGYSCDCDSRPGWAAKSERNPRCVETDKCQAGQPCLNGGTCRYISPGTFTCACLPAWTGHTCTTPRDPCASSPCGPGWRCRRESSSAAGFSCGCELRPGWRAVSSADPTCVLFEPCRAKAPCGHGGTCVSTLDGDQPGFQCQCPPAWTGPVCDEPRNPCAAGDALCGAGWSCRRDAASRVGYSCGCRSRSGWRPRALDDPTCVPNDQCRVRRPCRNGGRCGPGIGAQPFTCSCPAAWQGPLCQKPRDPCQLGSPCSASGMCTRSADSKAGFSCNCSQRPGYRARSPTDPRCVLEDACAAFVPCLHGGTCALAGHGPRGYTCQCTPAWSGATCATPRDPCLQDADAVSRTCAVTGSCVRDPGSEVGFSCECESRPGWRARSASEPSCVVQDACLALRPCRHGGSCRNTADPADGFYRCFCHPAWKGNNCTEPRDPCTEEPRTACNAGFRCRRNALSALGFSCGCDEKPGFRAGSASNPDCEVYDTCLATEPCVNGGTCVPVGEKLFYCECSKTWTGKKCGVMREPCEGLKHTCAGSWRCHRDAKQPLGFTCGCSHRPGWTAAADGHCVVSDPCLANAPCANGGTCSPEGGQMFSCLCRPGWGGATCQTPVDPCDDGEPCGAEFPCRRDPTEAAGFRCGCETRPGWRRLAEDDPRCQLYDTCLAEPPCLGGGRCLSLGAGNFSCVCPPGRRGRLCEVELTTPAAPTAPPPPPPVSSPARPASSTEQENAAEDEDEEDERTALLRPQPVFRAPPDRAPALAGLSRALDELGLVAPKLKYLLLLVLLLAAVVLLFLLCFVCWRRLCRACRRRDDCKALRKRAEFDRKCEQYVRTKYGCDEPYPPCSPRSSEYAPLADEDEWDDCEPYRQPYP